MTKKLRLQRRGGGFENLPDGGGYNYFGNLPDELVIVIFTKLSSSSDDEEEYLDDIKSLGRCSAVCKRFDALSCLVPTLSLRHPDMNTLYQCCPKILKKFKHIRSLQVTHSFTPSQQHKPLPFIFWEAAYRPRHSYRLSVVSSEKFSHYIHDPQNLMLSDDADAAKVDDFLELNRHNMIYLHHMLVYSIKDHMHLQRVVVSDFNDGGTLTLEDDMLVELRNCTSTIYRHQVWARDRLGSVKNLDVITSLKPRSGVVMKNVYFSTIEWWEKDTEYHAEDEENEDGLPRGMHFKCHEGVNLLKVLTSAMKNPNYGKGNDAKFTCKILSHIKSEGYLL